MNADTLKESGTQASEASAEHEVHEMPTAVLTPDEKFAEMVPTRKRVIPPRSKLVLFNSLGHAREDVAC